jgi:hypothetical protein
VLERLTLARYWPGSSLGEPYSDLFFLKDFYDPGRGSGTPNPHVSAGQRDALFPTRVTNKQAIIDFLNSLTATNYDRTVPAAVPSGLPVGGNIH